MKKYAALLLAALVVCLGLAGFTTSGAANATGICPTYPYSGCVGTHVAGTHPPATVHVNKKSHHYTAKVRINVEAGNHAPQSAVKGTVTIVIKRYGKVIATRHLTYHQGMTVSRSLPTGKYQISVQFVPAKGSAAKGSTTVYHFTVKK